MCERFISEYNGEAYYMNTGLKQNYKILEWDNESRAYIYCGQVWVKRGECPISAYHAAREESEY